MPYFYKRRQASGNVIFSRFATRLKESFNNANER